VSLYGIVFNVYSKIIKFLHINKKTKKNKKKNKKKQKNHKKNKKNHKIMDYLFSTHKKLIITINRYIIIIFARLI
jgi:hypothetical protein